MAARGVRSSALLMLLAWALVAGNVACAASSGDETAKREAGSSDAMTEARAADLAQQWGIEITSIRLTANDHMIDYRYRVLDSDKAADLFERQIKPYLIHQKTEKVLAVPETAKLGPLRNSNIPQAGKIYWMFFGNANSLVKAGDRVTVVIGEFRIEDLVVQ
jgi:hypothetical protein